MGLIISWSLHEPGLRGFAIAHDPAALDFVLEAARSALRA
jgi:hypothetical protein